MSEQKLSDILTSFFNGYDGWGGDVVTLDRQEEWISKAILLEAKDATLKQKIADIPDGRWMTGKALKNYLLGEEGKP